MFHQSVGFITRRMEVTCATGACVSTVPCCVKFCYFDSHIVWPLSFYEQSSLENPYESFNKYVLSGSVLNIIEIKMGLYRTYLLKPCLMLLGTC
jgi:hypothetical protein